MLTFEEKAFFPQLKTNSYSARVVVNETTIWYWSLLELQRTALYIFFILAQMIEMCTKHGSCHVMYWNEA